jgi:uncharacterized membrane protein YfcA
VTLGVLVGSIAGAHFLVRARAHVVRVIFSIVIALLGLEMLVNGITKSL